MPRMRWVTVTCLSSSAPLNEKGSTTNDLDVNRLPQGHYDRGCHVSGAYMPSVVLLYLLLWTCWPELGASKVEEVCVCVWGFRSRVPGLSQPPDP